MKIQVLYRINHKYPIFDNIIIGLIDGSDYAKSDIIEFNSIELGFVESIVLLAERFLIKTEMAESKLIETRLSKFRERNGDIGSFVEALFEITNNPRYELSAINEKFKRSLSAGDIVIITEWFSNNYPIMLLSKGHKRVSLDSIDTESIKTLDEYIEENTGKEETNLKVQLLYHIGNKEVKTIDDLYLINSTNYTKSDIVDTITTSITSTVNRILDGKEPFDRVMKVKDNDIVLIYYDDTVQIIPISNNNIKWSNSFTTPIEKVDISSLKYFDSTPSKRQTYISWDEYFMGVAIMSSCRSKDPSTQVGACIVSEDKRILSIGYNGFPNGCGDDQFPWDSKSIHGQNETKYPYVVHAELNAILNAARQGVILNGSILYVTLFPCNECAKAIIQSGIKKIIYACDKHADYPETIASKRMLTAAGIDYESYNYSENNIVVKL